MEKAMKKGLIGCLLVGTLLIAVGAGLAWWFVLRPIVGAGNEVAQGVRDWARAADAEAAVRNQSPFTAPADGRLTQEQVNRFVVVQGDLALRLGPELASLKQQLEQAQAEQDLAGKAPDLAQAMQRSAALADLVARAREGLVEGLNRQDMSLAEYRWIRDQAYAALPFLDLDPDAMVGRKPPEGAAVDAATGEVIVPADETTDAAPAEAEIAGSTGDEEEALTPAEAMAREAEKVAGTPAETSPAPDTAADEMKAANASAAAAEAQARADAAAGTAVGDESQLDDPATQAARANAVLLRPHKDLLLRTLGSSWVGL